MILFFFIEANSFFYFVKEEIGNTHRINKEQFFFFIMMDFFGFDPSL